MTPDDDPDVVIEDAVPDDNFGSDTKAHYTPVAPRPPALDMAEKSFAETHGFFALPPPLIRAEMMKHDSRTCEVCAVVRSELAHQADDSPPARRVSIAEQFQDILWQAFYAGATGDDATHEAFVRWYERTVLR